MRPLKVLIVDDTPANAVLVETVVTRLGHQAIIAENGQQALDLFESEHHDLILMDVMMPVMDGITTTKILRERMRDGTRWVPIVILSALDDINDIIRGIQAGADDYIVKPVNIQLLKAKISNLASQIDMQEQILQHTAELTTWRTTSQREADLGAHIMGRLTSVGDARSSFVQQFNIPAEIFSGDLICAARTPDDTLHLMLADAAGHGLPAALTAIPTAQIFYRMTEKGFPIASIAKEMNDKLRSFLPADRFIAVTMASVDITTQTIEIFNSGNPNAVLTDGKGGILRECASKHPPLGILPSANFAAQIETIPYETPCNLLICSDGLWEAENAEGIRLQASQLTGIFTLVEPERYLEAFHTAVNSHIGNAPAHDDISCLIAHIPNERRQTPRIADLPAQATASTDKGEWHMAISYRADDLKYLDIVPSLLDLLCQIRTLQPHKGSLFVIVSELFNNALDHGLLGLDSSLKATGFEQYLRERETRLTALVEGRIDLSFRLHSQGEGQVLDIMVGDTGPGFDHARYLDPARLAEASTKPHGRGIALVHNLCRQLRYAGNGNQVSARIAI